MHKREISKWSGQFFAAAELTRRGYRVSITSGNAPSMDIVAVSAKSSQFKVEVKTVRRKGASWLVPKVPRDTDLYYILVVSRPKDEYPPPEYWILTSREIRAILQKKKRAGLSEPQVYLSDMSDDSGWEKLPDYKSTIKLGV